MIQSQREASKIISSKQSKLPSNESLKVQILQHQKSQEESDKENRFNLRGNRNEIQNFWMKNREPKLINNLRVKKIKKNSNKLVKQERNCKFSLKKVDLHSMEAFRKNGIIFRNQRIQISFSLVKRIRN